MTKLLKRAGIYVLRNQENGKCYVGKDIRLGKRAKEHLALKHPACSAIYRAIKKHGANNFKKELIHYPNISHAALCEVEKWKIRQLGSHASQGGYNLTQGGDGLDSEKASEIALKQLAEGTHPFQDSNLRRKTNEINHKNTRKRVADGTHNWAGQSNPVYQRIAEGTHNFQDSDFQREVQRKRVKDGTHPFLGEHNPSHRRVAEGNHNFQDSDFQRKVQRKRIEDGTHPFLSDKNPVYKQLADGTNKLLDPHIRRKGRYAKKLKQKNQRRELYRIYAALLYTKSVCQERIYRKRIREGFFNKEIPDTSKSEQLDLLLL